jgi:hypothetical protein
MPVQSIVKLNQDPHPDYFTALDKLAPFAIKTLDLGKHWELVSSIGSLKLDWSYNNNTEKFTYKIAEITIARLSHISEISIPRSIKFGGIIIDDIPFDVQAAIEDIMDEAWLYCIGQKTAQLNLFEIQKKMEPNPPPIVQRSKTVEALLELGVERYKIDDYLGVAGDFPTVDGFAEWQEEEEAEQPSAQYEDRLMDTAKVVASEAISRSKGTRSKAKKEAA